jgi:hypothetical protein
MSTELTVTARPDISSQIAQDLLADVLVNGTFTR